MTAPLLIGGALFLLLLAAAGIEAYVRGQTRRPLARSRPDRISQRTPGQFATDTSLLQDMLQDRPRRSRAHKHKKGLSG